MKEIIESGDIGAVQYISARRLNLGLFQKDINVAWDLAPHDISIILHLLDEFPVSVSCQGSSHVTRGIEDVTMMYMTFEKNRCAFVHNSWLDPKKVRQMTVVGSRRMIVYDDTEPLEKLKIYDARVEVPPHYDSFAEFTYSYHYGDAYVPYIKQDEPLKLECTHFLECIREGRRPITDGRLGLDVVRILEASGKSLREHGAAVALEATPEWGKEAGLVAANGNGNGHSHVNGNGNGNGHVKSNGGTNGHEPAMPSTTRTIVAA